ncbi:MAG TPA: hypothetical protein VK915_08640 [Gaiellaceae bacterium]|nr:hypothetical protein [Gaiellaceae bacterium]
MARIPNPPVAVRVALALFVLLWIFGPYSLRTAVPIWAVFLVALALEVHFFLGALGRPPAPVPDRGPQVVDRDLYGYRAETEDLLLVRRGGEEYWIPYAGEADDEEIEALIAEAGEREETPEEPAHLADERADLWTPVRGLATGLGVIGALALGLWFVESRTGWDALEVETRQAAQARFSEEASLIAGKPVRIRCDEAGEFVGAVLHADGVATVGGDLSYLTPDRCLDLYRLAFEGEVRGSQTARSIAVLAHEAWHLRGVRDEGETECYALQSGVDLGQRLGLDRDHARRLMRQQLVENSGRTVGTLEYRVPPECRDGGPLDLRPDDPRFP